MLKLKDVSKYYYQDGVVAQGISKVNLELNIGEFVVITGESGSGKSTLLNVLSGLDTYEDGELYINGEETSHYTENDYLLYRRKYVSNIFQTFNLVNSYSVYQNIELAMLLNGEKSENIKRKINEIIDRVGLSQFKNTKVSKLSGGQKQRVAIARCLANDTPIIVADEPTGSLDSLSSKEIIKILKEISRDKLVIIVTHNKKEVEEHATRLIKMFDGKVLENKVLTKVNLDDTLETKKVKDISLFSKFKLSLRNAFNIPVKFILLYIVFLLISITLIYNYGSIKQAEFAESNTSYNGFFRDSKDSRIVVQKMNKELFNEEDIKSIKKIPNIIKVVENDSVIDYEISIFNDNLYLSGFAKKNDITKVNIGRTIQNNNEVIVRGSVDNWYLNEYKDSLLNENFSLDNLHKYNKKIKIVGIIYDESYNDYYTDFYFAEEAYDDIFVISNQGYTNHSLIINNKNVFRDIYVVIRPLDKVQKSEMYITDYFSGYCKNYNCKKDKATLIIDNIYFDGEKSFTISNIINKNNSKKILGMSYDELDEAIYINPEDFEELYKRGIYQISVYVDELNNVDNVSNKIENSGFKTLKIRDTKIDERMTIIQIMKIYRLIFVSVLVLALFFITYFIIKVIFKSRNSYYTTLRTLGSTKKVCIDILRKELVIVATFTYATFLIFSYLVHLNIIKLPSYRNILKYVYIRDFVIVYIIIVLMSIIIAYRYGRKIFKNSIIKTYGERL